MEKIFFMDCVVFKSFIDDFYHRYDLANNIHRDFNEYLLDIPLDTRFIIDVSSMEELIELSTGNPIWELLLERFKKNLPVFEATLSKDIESIEFYKKYRHPVKIFFTNLSHGSCANLSYKYGYEYVSIENIENIWLKYASFKSYIMTISKFKYDYTFHSWDKISVFCYPSNSIIIFDKYLFTEYTKTKNGSPIKTCSIDDNLFKLFSSIISNKQNAIKLHICIFTDFRNVAVDDDAGKGPHSNCIEYIYEKISKYIFNKFPNINYELAIINYHHNISKAEKFHDRFVVTNNVFLQFGPGINIFSLSNEVMVIGTINCLLMIKLDRRAIDLQVDNIRAYLSDLYNQIRQKPHLKNKYIIGDFKHRMLI